MDKKVLVTASIFGALAVILGAFGAHGLKVRISASDLENWKTAVDYHFYHTLAILILSAFARGGNKVSVLSFYSFCIGILLFSGSLYLLSTRSITGISSSVLGPITPIGGLFFIIGWLSLLFTALKGK